MKKIIAMVIGISLGVSVLVLGFNNYSYLFSGSLRIQPIQAPKDPIKKEDILLNIPFASKLLTAPVLELPYNNSNQYGLGNALEFYWKDVKGASKFALFVKFDDGEYKIYPRPANGFGYAAVPYLDLPSADKNHTVTWKIRAYDVNNAVVDSVIWKFNLLANFQTKCVASPSIQEQGKPVNFTITPKEGVAPYAFYWPPYFKTTPDKASAIGTFLGTGKQRMKISVSDKNQTNKFFVPCEVTITQSPSANAMGVPLPTVGASPVKNLDDLYKLPVDANQINQLVKDFNIQWIDNEKTGEKWPTSFSFDQNSGQPSKGVIISLLNILLHQSFSEPLPLGPKSIYDYLKANTQSIKISLECGNNNDAGGNMFLMRSFGYWKGLYADCTPSPYPNYYVDQLALFIHEARHADFGDPGHLSCGIQGGNDEYFENGSGYSAAATYLMWIYKYGINDSAEAKNRAKLSAASLLKERFCKKPVSGNPKVQVIIDELYK